MVNLAQFSNLVHLIPANAGALLTRLARDSFFEQFLRGSPAMAVALFMLLTLCSENAGAGLNDSGVDWCSSQAANFLDCPATGFRDQDGDFGRDALARSGNLIKIGAGAAGFDFTKLDSVGNSLPEAAPDWDCVRDNNTGLVWEVKSASAGLQNYANTYTWSGSGAPDAVGSGVQDGGACSGSSCDTLQYINEIRNLGLCGLSDWRLPTVSESRSIVDHSLTGLTTDTAFFPNASTGPYWTANLYPGSQQKAWDIYLDRGLSYFAELSAPRRIRLVSGERLLAMSAATEAESDHCHGDHESTIPGSHFSIKSGGASIEHLATNLEWRTCLLGQEWDGGACRGSAERLSWESALLEAGEHAGWRLPSLPELESLVERCRTSPSLNTEVFPNGSLGWTWSSTPFAADAGKARLVSFIEGIDGLDDKSSRHFVRLVRSATGGGSGDSGDLSLSLTTGGAGSIFVENDGFVCAGSCKRSFPAGTEVVLTAYPDAGYSATGWSGHCEPHPAGCVITMDEPRAVTADFQPVAGRGRLRRVEPVISGAWYHPTRSGEGFQIEILSPEQAVVTWFTYDASGNQAWFTGVGGIYGNSIFVPELLATNGPSFGDSFYPDDLVTRVKGALRLEFQTCNAGWATYDFPVDGLSGSVPVQRLAKIPGAVCNPAGDSPRMTGASYSGSWNEPSTNGQGFMFQSLPDRNLLAVWYTYRPDGSQAWLVGVGSPDGTGSRYRFDQMDITAGARFGDEFDPEHVVTQAWGELEVVFESCDSAILTYQGEFGSGSMDLSRITNLHNADCMPVVLRDGLRVGTEENNDALISANIGAQYIEVTSGLIDELNLAVGTEFTLPGSDRIPGGLAARVTSINASGSSARVYFEPLEFDEVLASGAVSASRQLRPADLDPDAPLTQTIFGSPTSGIKYPQLVEQCGSGLVAAQQSALEAGYDDDELFVLPVTNSASWAWDQGFPFDQDLPGGGSLASCLVLSMQIHVDVERGALNSIESSSFIVEVAVHGTTSVEFPVQMSWSDDWSLLPQPLKFARIPVDSLGILWVVPSLDFKAGVHANIGSAYSVELSAETTSTAGVVYDIDTGMRSVSGFSKDFSMQSPGATVGAELGGSIGPEVSADLELGILRLLSGSADVRATARAEAAIVPESFWAVYAGVKSTVGLDIRFLDPFDAELFHHEWRIASSDSNDGTHYVQIDVQGDGALYDGVGNLVCEDSCALSVPDGSALDLSAVSSAGSRFAEWVGASQCDEIATCTLTITGPATIGARFVENTGGARLLLSLSGAGHGRLDVIDQTSVPTVYFCEPHCALFSSSGASYLVEAIPEQDSVFSGWSGECEGEGSVCELSVSPGDSHQLEAIFSPSSIEEPSPGNTGAGEVFLVDGELAGQQLGPALWKVTVGQGQPLSGSITTQTRNFMPENAVAPFGYTWTWGDRATAFVQIDGSVPNGSSTHTSNIELIAPTQPESPRIS